MVGGAQEGGLGSRGEWVGEAGEGSSERRRRSGPEWREVGVTAPCTCRQVTEEQKTLHRPGILSGDETGTWCLTMNF